MEFQPTLQEFNENNEGEFQLHIEAPVIDDTNKDPPVTNFYKVSGSFVVNNPKENTPENFIASNFCTISQGGTEKCLPNIQQFSLEIPYFQSARLKAFYLQPGSSTEVLVWEEIVNPAINNKDIKFGSVVVTVESKEAEDEIAEKPPGPVEGVDFYLATFILKDKETGEIIIPPSNKANLSVKIRNCLTANNTTCSPWNHLPWTEIYANGRIGTYFDLNSKGATYYIHIYISKPQKYFCLLAHNLMGWTTFLYNQKDVVIECSLYTGFNDGI